MKIKLCKESKNLFKNMNNTLSCHEMCKYDNFIKEMKKEKIWNKIEFFYIFNETLDSRYLKLK